MDWEKSPLSAALGGYLDWMIAHGRRTATAKNAAVAVRACIRVLGDVPAGSVGTDEAYRLVAGLAVGESSRHAYAMRFGEMLEWATGRNPVRNAKILWSPADVRRTWISTEDWEAMMAAADERGRLVLALGACMGLRRGDIAALDVGSLDGRTLTVCGKGHGRGKVRRMEAPAPVLDAWRGYMAVRKPAPCEDALIIARNGRRASPGAVAQIVERAAGAAGVEATTHSLRRLYAMTLYRSGLDLKTIQALMGHASALTTIQCYIEADPERMRGALDAINRAFGKGSARGRRRAPRTKGNKDRDRGAAPIGADAYARDAARADKGIAPACVCMVCVCSAFPGQGRSGTRREIVSRCDNAKSKQPHVLPDPARERAVYRENPFPRIMPRAARL